MPHCHYTYICSFLVSDSYHIILMIVLHTAHHSTRLCSLPKTVLEKIRDWYQAYCTTYKMHAMATHHGGTGHLLDRGLYILVEDPEHTDIDNESTHSSDATVALGGPEAVGHPKEPVHNNQDRLTALAREINDLHQRETAGKGQPAETLDHIQHELQNLLIAIHQPHAPAPDEPLREVIWYYMDTLCTTQKQSNLTNSLLQDIFLFNEHYSIKLEDWLTDIKTAADLTSEGRARLAKAKSRGHAH